MLSRKIHFLSLQVVQIFAAGSQAEKRKKYCGLQQNEALLASIVIFFFSQINDCPDNIHQN